MPASAAHASAPVLRSDRFNVPAKPRGFDEIERTDRARRSMAMMDRRLQALAWWRVQMLAHPGGLVSIATATRILGVSRTRMFKLIANHQIPVVDGMPGGGQTDRFIPVDALLGAPSPAHAGRPRGWAANWTHAQNPYPGTGRVDNS